MNNYNDNKKIAHTSKFEGDINYFITNNIQVVFDAESVQHLGFSYYAMALCSADPNVCCYIPKFEYELLNQVNKVAIDKLININHMKVIDCNSSLGYKMFFSSLFAMGIRRIAIVLGDNADTAGIVNVGREVLHNHHIRAYKLTYKGTLVSRFQQHTNSTDINSKIGKAHFRDIVAKEREGGFALATRPEPIIISVLQRKNFIGIGSTVYGSQNKPIVLLAEVMVNSDSITYETNLVGVWAKIYVKESLTTLNEEKCKRMLTKKLNKDGICWPQDSLHDIDGIFAGILVPMAEGIPLSQCIFKGIDNGIRKYFPAWDKRQLVQLTNTILNIIVYLHKWGVLFGCLNPSSILVKDENTVYFTDMDHYQIEGFPCMIRNTMFTAPELQDKLQRNKLYFCTVNQEKYAVALLVFMLMMPGKMPYTIKDNNHAPEAIMQQNFAFSYKGEHGSDRSVGSWRFVWSHLTPFKEIFYRTFQKGERFNLPEDRPTDKQWVRVTSAFKDELFDDGLYDPHSRELIPESFKRSKDNEFTKCKRCGKEYPRRYFNNLYFEDYQICNTCLEEPSDISFTCVDCGRTFIYTNRTAIYHIRMKNRIDDWKKQRHCRDCKNKTTKCLCCMKEVPVYRINPNNGYCFECDMIHKQNEKIRREQPWKTVRCKDCGSFFEITVGEHESAMARGHDDFIRCKSCRSARKQRRF